MTGRVGIVTDSNAQLPPELVDRYGIEVVPLTVVVDGTAYTEGVDLDADSFYDRFETTTPAVSTAQPSPGRFAEAYQRVADGGATEILSVHIGSVVSGTLNSALVAAAGAPVPVRLVDTGTASFGVGCCVWEAAEALRAGAGVEEAAAVAEAVGATVGNVFVVKALDLARAGGRLAGDAGTVSEGIPVLSLVGGELVVVARSADVDGAADVMADYVRAGQDGGDAGRLRVAVGFADRRAAPLSQALLDRLTNDPAVEELVRYRVGPSVGAHTGPGTAGAFFYQSARASTIWPSSQVR